MMMVLLRDVRTAVQYMWSCDPTATRPQIATTQNRTPPRQIRNGAAIRRQIRRHTTTNHAQDTTTNTQQHAVDDEPCGRCSCNPRAALLTSLQRRRAAAATHHHRAQRAASRRVAMQQCPLPLNSAILGAGATVGQAKEGGAAAPVRRRANNNNPAVRPGRPRRLPPSGSSWPHATTTAVGPRPQKSTSSAHDARSLPWRGVAWPSPRRLLVKLGKAFLLRRRRRGCRGRLGMI